MRRLGVLKNVAYLAKTGGGTIANIGEVNLLADGAVAVFLTDGTMVAGTGATPPQLAALNGDMKGFIVFVGAPAGSEPLKSPIIQFGFDSSKQVYVAPVKQEQTIGDSGAGGSYNLPSPLVVGTEAFIRIQNLALGTLPAKEIYTFSTRVVTGDTATTIMTRLMNAINAHPLAKDLVTAAPTSAGIANGLKISVDVDNTPIDIGLDGILADATLTTDGTGDSTVIVYSSGSDADITELWNDYKAELGDTSQLELQNQLFTRANPVVAGATYTTYQIRSSRSRGNGIGANVGITNHLTELAVPAGAGVITQIDAILASLVV